MNIILLITYSTILSSHTVDDFLGTGKIPRDLPPGTSSILVRLGLALANAGSELHARIVENFKWEVNMHNYLENANFSTVGHFHLHAAIHGSPIVKMIKQIAVYQPNIIVGVDEGVLCEYVKSLTSEISQVYCTNSVALVPNDSLLIAVSERPREWHEKVVHGGVVFGVGRVNENLVKWRSWREIYFAPGELFWWFREP